MSDGRIVTLCKGDRIHIEIARDDRGNECLPGEMWPRWSTDLRDALDELDEHPFEGIMITEQEEAE